MTKFALTKPFSDFSLIWLPPPDFRRWVHIGIPDPFLNSRKVASQTKLSCIGFIFRVLLLWNVSYPQESFILCYNNYVLYEPDRDLKILGIHSWPSQKPIAKYLTIPLVRACYLHTHYASHACTNPSKLKPHFLKTPGIMHDSYGGTIHLLYHK